MPAYNKIMGLLISRRRRMNSQDDDYNIEETPEYAISETLRRELALMRFTEDEIAEVREAFCMFDKNRNGHISRKSFLTVIRSLGQNPTEDDYEDMLNEVDADRNGLIEYSEFLALFARRRDASVNYLFDVFDDKGIGTIKREDLRQILLLKDVGLTSYEIDDLLECFRADKHENINLEDFTKAFNFFLSYGTDC